MKHFHRLAQSIPIAPLIDAVIRHSELWNALAEPQQIILRNGPAFRDAEPMKAFGAVKKVALDAMATFGASQLGMLIIQKIAPEQRAVFKAIEEKDQFSHYRLVLHALPGSLFLAGDETVSMEPGELWWIDAKTTNAINNVTKDDVIHVLMQLRHDA